ncbi:peptidoglycan-binding protein [Nonomuraea sp. NPDC050540]|uniref:peptidoglycan-binding protein n=1 Tax=Nonomuraea sp. NPDC050540 TaxID=3364367 RepID=UPI003791783C
MSSAKWGSKVKLALMDFQARNGLDIDGEYGSQSNKKFELAHRPKSPSIRPLTAADVVPGLR